MSVKVVEIVAGEPLAGVMVQLRVPVMIQALPLAALRTTRYMTRPGSGKPVACETKGNKTTGITSLNGLSFMLNGQDADELEKKVGIIRIHVGDVLLHQAHAFVSGIGVRVRIGRQTVLRKPLGKGLRRRHREVNAFDSATVGWAKGER